MQEVNGSIAILGSGETSPNLVSVHRNLINKIDGEVIASLIDTPFGFQENADQLVDKLIEFYDVSLNLEINLASFRNKKYFKSVEYFEFIKKIQSSNFIFSGPGSPSYATKNWIDTDVPEIFKERLYSGSSLIFASAAASTLGIRTIPVYEIYKVGIDPYWEKGINLLEVFDIDCVVVPHFNNKEGGNHDTSISYLGAKRMEILQEIQPTNILGIDEHTALIIDAKENLFEVEGLGQVTVINQNETQNFKNGEKYSLDDLRKLLENTETKSIKESADNDQNSQDEQIEDVLRKEIAELRLEIEKNNKNSENINNLINKLISYRIELRSSQKYEESDIVRDFLTESNIEIEDDKNSSSWKFKD